MHFCKPPAKHNKLFMAENQMKRKNFIGSFIFFFSIFCRLTCSGNVHVFATIGKRNQKLHFSFLKPLINDVKVQILLLRYKKQKQQIISMISMKVFP